jgi:hypothetical protein
MADFGQSQDNSGIFASLANEDLRRMVESTRSASNQARQDQAAADADTYNKWKKGEISDEEWIAYLEGRVADSAGDPEEHQRWTEALREHRFAVADAQIETQFRMGKVTAQQLMAHYDARMKAVKTNSPEWRELAGRYQDLADFASGGGTYYGSGGGGGGGGGGAGDEMPSDMPGTEGPVDPTNALRSPSALSEYYDGMMSDFLRIEDLMRQHEADPKALLVDMLTGETFEPSVENIAAIDRQYLMTQDVFAAAKWGEGKVDDATRALGAKSTYLSNFVTKHNETRLMPVYEQVEQSVRDRLVAASAISDPQKRILIYKQIRADLQSFEDGALPGQEGLGVRGTLREYRARELEGVEDMRGGFVRSTIDLPPELAAGLALIQRVDALEGLMDAFTDDNMDDQSRMQNVLLALNDAPREGGFSRAELEELIGYDGQDILGPDVNDGFTGGLFNRIQRDGVLYASDPTYEGIRFTHALGYWDEGEFVPTSTPQVVEAELTPTGEVVPFGMDTATMVKMVTRIGGRVTTVWAEPQEIESPEYMGYRAKVDIHKPGTKPKDQNDSTLIAAAGEWIPSSFMDNLSRSQLLDMQRTQSITRESAVLGVVAPDGQTWFYDVKTGLVTPNKPTVATSARGGLLVGDDAQPSVLTRPFARGVPFGYFGISRQEMQTFVTNSAMNGSLDLSGYRSVGPGGQVEDVPPDIRGLYWSPASRNQGRSRAGHDVPGLGADLIESERASGKDWQATYLTREQREAARGQRHGGAKGRKVQDLASAVGVKIGAGAAEAEEKIDPMRHPLHARDSAFEAQKARAAIQAQPQTPRFKPLAPKVAAVTPPKPTAPPVKKAPVTPAVKEFYAAIKPKAKVPVKPPQSTRQRPPKKTKPTYKPKSRFQE